MLNVKVLLLLDSMESDYKAKYEVVLKEKQQLELEFGQRRAQFRQLFLDLEGMYLFLCSVILKLLHVFVI